MGYTNKTTHYELPQYVATDKPKYLTDFNETMVAIDTQMYTNAQAAATADGKADAAQSTADGAVSSIGTLNTQINGDPTDPSDTGLNGQVADNSGDIDTIQALLGNGTPTTSNQTVIGAINGLEGAIAPREDGADLANSYSEGEQFARGGSVYKALTSLTAGTAFASLTLNTDYAAADTLVEQIAEVAGDIPTIPTGYVLVENHTVSVTADGVKTASALLDEAFVALSDYIATLPESKIFLYNYVQVPGVVQRASIEQDAGHFPRATIGTMTFTYVTCTSTGPRIITVNVKETGSSAYRADIDSTPSVTVADKSSTVVTNGEKVTLAVIIYEQI